MYVCMFSNLCHVCMRRSHVLSSRFVCLYDCGQRLSRLRSLKKKKKTLQRRVTEVPFEISTVCAYKFLYESRVMYWLPIATAEYEYVIII